MWKEFKAFAFKGNVVDMAVGVMIGGAFSSIVTSVVNDLFMPIIGLITGGIDFTNLFIALDGNKYATLAEAKEANAACFAYGSFLTAVLNFFLIAICIFFVVKAINKLKKPEAPAPKKEARRCPFCKSEISDEATRCPHCTSMLE